MATNNGSINTLNSLAAEEELLNRRRKLRPRIIAPLCGCLCVLLTYVSLGALLIADSQGWAYSEAFYFCFVSLLTIGYGGLRPSEPHLWPCVVYIFLGLALVSTCVHLLKAQVWDEMRRYKIVKMKHRSMLDSFETLTSSSGKRGGDAGGRNSAVTIT